MHPQAPAPLRRSGPRGLRRPLPRAGGPAPRPVPPDDTLNLRPRAAAGALFPPAAPVLEPETEERTAVTLPPAHSSRVHGRDGRGRRLAAAEREFLLAVVIALALSGIAFLGDRLAPGALSRSDLLLAGVVLSAALGMLALGWSSRRSR
jgi:hypothetical protein